MTTETTDIQITAAGEEPGARSLRVEIPVDRVRAAERLAASHFAKRGKLPGFRPGKAPLEVVRKRYGDAIRERVVRELVRESWSSALEQESLEPLAEPHVHHLKFEEGSPVTFEFHVEVKPDIRLERLGGFTLERRPVSVPEEAVDAQIEHLRTQKAPWVPVQSGKPVPGQLIQVSIAPIKEGKAADAQPRQFVLGGGEALPALEERILQLSVGETDDAEIRFPDDFPDEAKRGTSAPFRITLHEVKRQDLPELDDAFARELGDFDSFAALRTAVQTDLERDAAREADADVRRQMIEQIVAANNIVAPRPMVERILGAYAQAYKVADDQVERFRTEFAPIAEAQVKRDLVVSEIVEQQKISATDEEIRKQVAEAAARRNLDPEQLYATLEKNNRLGEIARNITEEKVFTHLLEQSTVTGT